jgi:hypothetical protein
VTLTALYDTIRPLHFTPLRVSFRLEEPLTVRRFAGSALRGALGWGLGRAVREGVYRRPPANVLGEGPFERLWEPRLDSEAAPKLNLAPNSRVVPPYVVSPPGPQEYAEGELFTFTLVLVGGTARALPLWIAACEDVARHGRLFRSDDQDSGVSARLAEIRGADGRLLFDREERVFTPGFYERGPRRLTADQAFRKRPPESPLSLRLRFETPTRITRRKEERRRLKREGTRGKRVRFVDRFHERHLGVLVERLYVRLFRLTQLYCADTVEAYEGRKGLPDPPDARIVQQDTSFESVTLSRKGEPQTLGALTGSVTIAGSLAPLYPLFALGEHLHVGKSTSAGFGHFSVSAEEFSGGDDR